MSLLEIKQIIVVTDGRSNVGGNPVTAAAEAFQNDIVVNAIGILTNSGEEDSLYEIQQIAKAGGGTWEHTQLSKLGATMLALTQKTINKTVQTLVGNQLKEIMGGSVEDIPPIKRSKVVGYMEHLAEEAEIKCCILMDCSGSMAQKMDAARQSILDLMNSLQSRKGRSQVAVIVFPGEKGEPVKVLQPFTEELNQIKSRITKLKAGGSTPTAAAINRGVEIMKGSKEDIEQIIINSEPLLKNSMV